MATMTEIRYTQEQLERMTFGWLQYHQRQPVGSTRTNLKWEYLDLSTLKVRVDSDRCTFEAHCRAGIPYDRLIEWYESQHDFTLED